jgi:hypothetical protein
LVRGRIQCVSFVTVLITEAVMGCPADACFLHDKAAMLRGTIKERSSCVHRSVSTLIV